MLITIWDLQRYKPPKKEEKKINQVNINQDINIILAEPAHSRTIAITNTKKSKPNSAVKHFYPSNQCFHILTRSLHFDNAEISRKRQTRISKFALIVEKWF